MKVLIAGGTGFIGRAMVKRYLSLGYDVTVLGRSRSKIIQRFNSQVNALTWDALREKPDVLRQQQLIINLTGATIGTKRWTTKRKAELLSSRIDATTLLAKLCASFGSDSPALFNTSAIGVYGLQESQSDALPTPFTEKSNISYGIYSDFLSEIGQKWEKAAQVAIDAGVRVVLMRFGVVLAGDGGALTEISRPFRFFLGGHIGTGRQPFTWIERSDLLNAIDFVYKNSAISGAVNFVAPECVPQNQLARTIASVLHRPCLLPVPAFVLKILLGEMAEELLLKGQHVKPERLEAFGFQFQYPTLQKALKHTFGKA